MKGGRCTNCGNQLERGFGLVNCLQCGTLLFIDLEGQVEKAESNQSSGLDKEDSPPPPPIKGFDLEPEQQNLIHDFEKLSKTSAPPGAKSNFEPITPPPLRSQPPSPIKTRGEIETPSRVPSGVRQRLDATRVVRPGAEDSKSTVPPIENVSDGFQALDFEANGQQVEAEMPPLPGEQFEDGNGSVDFLKGRSPEGEGLDAIKNFGNSDLSQGQDGSLYFDVIISGVDSKKIRDELRDCLTDRRFLWDVESLIKSIRKGELRLQGLSSVKTSVILSRLKELPVALRWIQTGLTELKHREPGV